MKIHHLNCCTFCPPGGYFMDHRSHPLERAKLVCHCLLIEGNNGLILVDTGLGMKDIQTPQARTSKFFRNLLHPAFSQKETAYQQIIDLGYTPSDVRHIILTHLDFDHAGGIDDFPNAQVHVMGDEVDAAAKRSGFISSRRYNPYQLTGMYNWNTYAPEGERWLGFECVRNLEGLPPEILLVPLVGHTEGHAGVAVQTDKGWLLHAGDAYFHKDEMKFNPRCPAGLAAFQRMMDVNHEKRVENQQRLRALAKNYRSLVQIFSAHDAEEFEDLKNGEERHLKGLFVVGQRHAQGNVDQHHF